MLVEETQSESEHVLEIQPAHRALAALVPVVDPEHQIPGIGGSWSPSSARYRAGGIIRFLAHSISPASSRRGRNLCGGGNAFASEAMSGALWSRTSGSGSPVWEDQSRESCDSAAEWNVRASTPSTSSAWSRRFSSPAALSVKVTARICDALERAAPNLAGDAMRDRGGLARSRAGHDGDRPAEREGGFSLRIVQSGKNALEIGHLIGP